MDTIFMNSRNSKTNDPHRLLLNVTDKINSERKYVALALIYVEKYKMLIQKQ